MFKYSYPIKKHVTTRENSGKIRPNLGRLYSLKRFRNNVHPDQGTRRCIHAVYWRAFYMNIEASIHSALCQQVRARASFHAVSPYGRMLRPREPNLAAVGWQQYQILQYPAFGSKGPVCSKQAARTLHLAAAQLITDRITAKPPSVLGWSEAGVYNDTRNGSISSRKCGL